MKGKTMREVRNDDSGNLDEVVADDIECFHLEAMDVGSWWIGLDHKDGTTTHISLSARRPGNTVVTGTCELNVQ
jgi:hypothetical protein